MFIRERKLIVLLLYKNYVISRGLNISNQAISDIIQNFKEFNATADTLIAMADYGSLDVLTDRLKYEVHIDRVFHRTLFFHISIKPMNLNLNSSGSIAQFIDKLLSSDRDGNSLMEHPYLVKRFKIVLPHLKVW